jgi:hypothetical protein
MATSKLITLSLPELHGAQDRLVNAPDYDPKVRFVVGTCGTKFGKAQSIETLILTLNGWKRAGDLQTGDYVFDENGKPTLVEFITPWMYGHKCYEVVFSDDSRLVVDAEHLWVTETHACRKAKSDLNGSTPAKRRRKTTNQAEKVVTTEEIKNTLLVGVGGKLRPNHSIPVVTAPILLEEKELLIDPYVLGAWLGDGNSNNNGISGRDLEIFDGIEKAGFSRYQTEHHKKEGIVWTFKGLTQKLNQAGVLNNKHVPEIYLQGSVEQRLALLQGLMDTDGTVSKRGDCCFDNTNKNLADAVAELAITLGIKVNREERAGKLNGVEKKLCYRIHFTTDLPVFRVKRKLERLRVIASKARRRFIVQVNDVDSVPVCCIRVANPKHLYLIGKSCIPTHNTFGLAHRMVRELWKSRPLDVFTWAAPIQAQTNIAYHLIKQMLPQDYYTERKRDSALVVLGADKKTERGTLYFRSALDPGHLRGEANRVWILDEAAYAEEEAFNSLLTTLTRTRGRGYLISTPRGRGWFYQKFCLGDKSRLIEGQEDPNPEWFSMKCPTWLNPTVSKEALDEMRRSISEMSWQQEVCAEFISDKAGVFGDFSKCAKGVLEEPQKDHYYVMGLDIAVLHDYTVITIFDRNTNHLVYFERFTRVPWPVFYERVINAARKYGNILCVMDSTGIGDPVMTPLVEANINVLPYKIGGSTAKHNLIEKLRIAIEHEKISFPPIAVLMDELVEYEYKMLSNGQFSYSAPSGHFDDTVISCALANWVLSEEPFVYTFANYRGI